MTHLSDYSFLQRVIGLSYIYLWYLFRIHQTSGYTALARLRQGEMKAVVSLLILFMIPFQLYYDIVSCTVKYREGFVQQPDLLLVPKPESFWTQAHQQMVTPINYSICIGFSLQTGTLLLLQCFWNHLTKRVIGTRFMSTKEFKVYVVWTGLNLLLFPLVEFNFAKASYDPTYKEIMPQLLYSLEMLLISLLGIVSHRRFRSLFVSLHSMAQNRLRYYQQLNRSLSIALFLFAVSLLTLTLDGLTQQKYLNRHKFFADFFICQVNVLMSLIWILVILILYPSE
ncbi:hypothetical protein BY458DRAFT_589350 [Sporodiniella umbellata]|nr:hypothetical protein BY458DRAFT_589350 [Sporodiniella umbellata]